MRPTNLLPFILILLAFSCKTERNDLQELNLKGKVLKLEKTSYTAEKKFGKYYLGQRNEWGNFLYEFNRKGNIVKTQVLDNNGLTTRVLMYEYDEDDNCAEVNIYEDEALTERQITSIKGDMITSVNVYDDKGAIKNIYKYKYSEDYISEIKVLDKNNAVVSTTTNDIENGLLMQVTSKDSLNQLNYIETYKRDRNGDIIEQTLKYPTDSQELKYSFSYEYDEHGNWIKRFSSSTTDQIDHIAVRQITYFDENPKKFTENDFIGIWFVVGDNDWFDFQNSNQYDYGVNDRIKKSGVWQIDLENQTLTLRANAPNDSKKYKYKFDGYQVVLHTLEGKEKLRLEKK